MLIFHDGIDSFLDDLFFNPRLDVFIEGSTCVYLFIFVFLDEEEQMIRLLAFFGDVD